MSQREEVSETSEEGSEGWAMGTMPDTLWFQISSKPTAKYERVPVPVPDTSARYSAVARTHDSPARHVIKNPEAKKNGPSKK
jgi:hypothetical protein